MAQGQGVLPLRQVEFENTLVHPLFSYCAYEVSQAANIISCLWLVILCFPSPSLSLLY